MTSCSRCGETKDPSSFYKDRGRPRRECKDCTSAIRRDHYEANRGRLVDSARHHRRLGGPRERHRERYATDPEYRSRSVAKVTNRYHASRAGTGDVTPEEWTAILDRHDYRCAYCCAPWEHMDHKVPLSRGGEHAPHNVIPSCADCNLSKGAKPLEVFLAVPR